MSAIYDSAARTLQCLAAAGDARTVLLHLTSMLCAARADKPLSKLVTRLPCDKSAATRCKDSVGQGSAQHTAEHARACLQCSCRAIRHAAGLYLVSPERNDDLRCAIVWCSNLCAQMPGRLAAIVDATAVSRWGEGADVDQTTCSPAGALTAAEAAFDGQLKPFGL